MERLWSDYSSVEFRCDSGAISDDYMYGLVSWTRNTNIFSFLKWGWGDIAPFLIQILKMAGIVS